MREALRKRCFEDDVVDETLARLIDLKLVDDSEFARTYAELRDRSSPRSRRLIAAELRAKGVGRAILEEPLIEIDEADAAYRAAERRARSLATADFADFRRRLGDHLLRRGFSFEVARQTVGRLWSETRGTAEEASADE